MSAKVLNFNEARKIVFNNEEINKVYLGYKLVWEQFEDINVYKIRLSGNSNNSYFISLISNKDNWTDWGDGTVDNSTSHTYNLSSSYDNNEFTIKTVNKFHASSCTEMVKHLYECSNLALDTNNYAGMFKNCKSLRIVKARLDSSVKDCSHMFDGCKYITDVPAIPANAVDCSYMFNNCSTLVVPPPRMPDTVEDCSYMFANCSKLEIPFDDFISKSATNCSHMFDTCYDVTRHPIIPEGVTNCSYMMKYTAITAIKKIPEGVLDCSHMYENCTKLVKVNIDGTNCLPSTLYECSYMFRDCRSLININNIRSIPDRIENCSYMFAECRLLEDNLQDFVLGNNIKDCNHMFYLCSNILFDVKIPRTVEDCSYMFANCSSLTEMHPDNRQLIKNTPSTMKHEKCYRYCDKLQTPPFNTVPDTWK